MTETDSSVTTWHGDTFPADCCDNCRGRRAEGLELKARVRLPEDAISRDEHIAVIRKHVAELVGMLRERGLA